jgi:hypothetical protein
MSTTPTATTKPVVPTGGQARRPKPPLRVHRGAPVPHDLQLLLQDLYQCQDCCSEVRWDLRVAIGHDPICITMKEVK